MRWTHEAYRDNLGRFGRRDGIKALAAYGLWAAAFFRAGCTPPISARPF